MIKSRKIIELTLFFCIMLLVLSPLAVQPQVIEGLKVFSGVTQKNTINDIFCDGSYVWCATDGGLVKWNTENDKYEIISVSPDGLGSVPAYCIAQDENDALWVGIAYGVSCYDGTAWTTYRDIDASYEEGRASVKKIVINNGNIWLGMYRFGLTLYDGETWKTFSIQNNDPPIPRIRTVYALTCDLDGVLWVGFQKGHTNAHYGLASCSNGEWGIITMYNSGLPGYYVQAAAVDSNNVKWFATQPGGDYDRGIASLCSYDGEAWAIYTTEDGLVNNDINAITVDKNNNKWIGTERGLSMFDGTEWKTYDTEFRVLSLSVDENNKLWVGTDSGLYRLDGETFIRYYIDEEPPYESAQSCVVDKTGGIWFATKRSYHENIGLMHYDGSQFHVYTRSDGLANNDIRDLAVDNDNTLWIATAYGLSRYDGTFSTVFSKETCSVEVENDSIIWFGTKKGIVRYDGDTMLTYDNIDDLGGLAINDIEINDHTGEKWFIVGRYNSTTYESFESLGVTKFDGTTWTFYRMAGYGYPDINGLCSTDVEDIEIDNEGRVWCACDGGLTIFDGETTTNITDDEIRYFNGSYWTVEETEYFWQITNINTIAFSNDNTAWLGSASEYVGLIKYRGSGWESLNIEHGFPRSPIYDIAMTQEGGLWFTTYCGICYYQDETITTTISDTSPSQIDIIYNHPNPFNPSTTISFTLSESGDTYLSVYNITGQKVRELVDIYLHAGSNSIIWDGCDDRGIPVSSGIYFARLVNGNNQAVQKMLLLK